MDHYQTLQVTRDAEPEVIERAYRALSRKHHPDMVPPADRERATERMRQINAAYRVLGDPERRRAYDSELASHPTAWDQFLDRGLVGLFMDAMRAKKSR